MIKHSIEMDDSLNEKFEKVIEDINDSGAPIRTPKKAYLYLLIKAAIEADYKKRGLK